MPGPFTPGSQKNKRWKEANVEFASMETRIRGLTNGIIRALRRIKYADKNLADATRPYYLQKAKKSRVHWEQQLKAFRAELDQLLDE